MDYAKALWTNAFRDTRSTATTVGVLTIVASSGLDFVIPESWEMKASDKSYAIANLLGVAAVVWGTRLLG